MKLFNSKAILLALLLTSILSFSQSNSINQTLFGHQLTDANIEFIDHSGVIRCGSVEYEQYLKALHPKWATTNDLIVNTSDLSKGVYFIKITANKNSISLPFVKN